MELWQNISRLQYATRMLGVAVAANRALGHALRSGQAGLFAPLYPLWSTENLARDGYLDKAVASALAVLPDLSQRCVFGRRVDSQLVELTAGWMEQLGDGCSSLELLHRHVEALPLDDVDRPELLLSVARRAERQGQLSLADEAYSRILETVGPTYETGRAAARGRATLHSNRAWIRGTAEELAIQLCVALRSKCAEGLWELCSKTQFIFSLSCGDARHTPPETILNLLLSDLSHFEVAVDPSTLRSTGGSSGVLAVRRWDGPHLRGPVMFTFARTAFGWEWNGVVPAGFAKDPHAHEHAIFGPRSDYENQPLEIQIEAPWPAGVSLKAGGGLLGAAASSAQLIAGLFAGPFGLLARDAFPRDLCGAHFANGGWYYNQGTHDDNKFAIDFTRWPRYTQIYPWTDFGTLNESRNTPVLAVADGHIQGVKSDVATGTWYRGNNSVQHRIWKSASIAGIEERVPLGTLPLAGGVTDPTFVRLGNLLTPYQAGYAHLGGPGQVVCSFAQFVEKGFVLGVIDSTDAPFDHLHFEIRDNRLPSDGTGNGDLYGGTVRPTPMGTTVLSDADDGRCVTSTNEMRNPVAACALLGDTVSSPSWVWCHSSDYRRSDPTPPSMRSPSEFCHYLFDRLVENLVEGGFGAPADLLATILFYCQGLIEVESDVGRAIREGDAMVGGTRQLPGAHRV